MSDTVDWNTNFRRLWTSAKKDKLTSAVIAFFAIWLVSAILNPPPGPVEPCPYVMESIVAPSYFVGRNPLYQTLVVKVNGVVRRLDCAGADRCPILANKRRTLALAVDACSLEDTHHRLMVYEMRELTDTGEQLLFKRKK